MAFGDCIKDLKNGMQITSCVCSTINNYKILKCLKSN